MPQKQPESFHSIVLIWLEGCLTENLFMQTVLVLANEHNSLAWYDAMLCGLELCPSNMLMPSAKYLMHLNG